MRLFMNLAVFHPFGFISINSRNSMSGKLQIEFQMSTCMKKNVEKREPGLCTILYICTGCPKIRVCTVDDRFSNTFQAKVLMKLEFHFQIDLNFPPLYLAKNQTLSCLRFRRCTHSRISATPLDGSTSTLTYSRVVLLDNTIFHLFLK